MWIPAVSDSTLPGVSVAGESIIEAAIEMVPERALAGVEFVWLRDEPTRPSANHLVLSFRVDAEPESRQAAIIRDADTIVVEIYVQNVLSGLTDEWLRQEWGIEAQGLSLSSTEKLELTLFSVLLHNGIRNGQAEEARVLVRLIGRVVFRAAVRRAIKNLQAVYPAVDFDHASPSSPGQGQAPLKPIDAEEIARTDFDQLWIQLLGLDDKENPEA